LENFSFSFNFNDAEDYEYAASEKWQKTYAPENCICGFRCIERKMRSILQTVRELLFKVSSMHLLAVPTAIKELNTKRPRLVFLLASTKLLVIYVDR
jgi:hypothetical protein